MKFYAFDAKASSLTADDYLTGACHDHKHDSPTKYSYPTTSSEYCTEERHSLYDHNQVSSDQSYLAYQPTQQDDTYIVDANHQMGFSALPNIPMDEQPILHNDAHFQENQEVHVERHSDFPSSMIQEQPVSNGYGKFEESQEVTSEGRFEIPYPLIQEHPILYQNAGYEDMQEPQEETLDVQQEGVVKFPTVPVQLPQPTEEYHYLPPQHHQAPTKAAKARKSDEVMMCILDLHQQYQHSGMVFKTADLIRLSGLDVAPRRIHDVMPPFELFGMVERRTKGEYEFKPKRQMEPLEEGAMNGMLKTIVKYVEVFKTLGGQCENYSANKFAKTYDFNLRRIYDVQTSLKYLGVIEYDTRKKTARLL